MKSQIIPLAAFGLGYLLLGCTPGSELRAFIPGRYVSHAQGEFSISCDTLIIHSAGHSGEVYRMERRSAFRRVEQGALQPRERKREVWTGHLEEESRTITESRRGKRIRFFPEGGYLLLERRTYQKID